MPYTKIARPILDQLFGLIKSYKWTTYWFMAALTVEALLLLFFFPFLVKSALFAVTLAALLVTLFSFYTLKNYQAAEKEAEMRELVQKYLRGVGSHFASAKTPAEVKHLNGSACLELAGNELAEYLSLKAAAPEPSKWIPSFLIGYKDKLMKLGEEEDLLSFRKAALSKAVEEFTQEVRLSPCSVQAHLRLGRAWMTLFELSPSEFKEAASRGLQEFKLVNDLSPDNPEVLRALADGCLARGDREGEVAALERLSHLSPRDPDLLLRLGKLYFLKQETAKGFKLYEAIKLIDLQKSDELMANYQ